MSRHILVLMSFVIILFSSLFPGDSSGDIPRFSFFGWYGVEEGRLNDEPIPPGGVIEVDISTEELIVCLTDDADVCDLTDDPPEGVTLISETPEVVSVSTRQALDGVRPSLILHQTGSAILEVRERNAKVASFTIVVRPVPAGTFCETFTEGVSGITDCSGQCVKFDEFVEKYGNGICDDGKRDEKGERTIDLSCIFIPQAFLSAPEGSLNPSFIQDEALSKFGNPLERDGGDCSAEDSCRAQFGDAPGYEFCSASASTCRFNATTRMALDAIDGLGTCASMCNQFSSTCVAALDNNPAGCTPLPNSKDTCQSRRSSEICICERR